MAWGIDTSTAARYQVRDKSGRLTGIRLVARCWWCPVTGERVIPARDYFAEAQMTRQ